jgi:hypothetical protein
MAVAKEEAVVVEAVEKAEAGAAEVEEKAAVGEAEEINSLTDHLLTNNRMAQLPKMDSDLQHKAMKRPKQSQLNRCPRESEFPSQ